MTILLHGFWGQPADWDEVLRRLSLGRQVLTPDLYEPGLLAPHVPLEEWPAHFWRWVEENHGDEPVQIVGYSMGARLAVAAASARPERVSRALFLSGSPLHFERSAWEKEWTDKFLRQDWPELEQEWQDLPVFSKSPAVPRRRSPQLREALGLSLSLWSPSRQWLTTDNLRAFPATFEWGFGALDQKYLEVAKTLQELPVKGQISIIPQAGHRLLSDAAEFVSQWIERGET